MRCDNGGNEKVQKHAWTPRWVQCRHDAIPKIKYAASLRDPPEQYNRKANGLLRSRLTPAGASPAAATALKATAA
jgi:hypothetical protein